MSFESLIRPQKSPDSGSGGGSTPEGSTPKNFHEAFLLYQQAKTQKERASLFEEWLPLCKSLDEIIEFMDHLSADSPEFTTNPEDESVDIATEADEDAVLDLNSYRALYEKMDKKIVEIYLNEIEKAGSIAELKALYKKLDDNSIVYPEGDCEIPTLRKWFELETTQAGLNELLSVIRNDFENQNLPKLVDLRRNIKAKLVSLN